jgi:hypothetical protein
MVGALRIAGKRIIHFLTHVAASANCQCPPVRSDLIYDSDSARRESNRSQNFQSDGVERNTLVVTLRPCAPLKVDLSPSLRPELTLKT